MYCLRQSFNVQGKRMLIEHADALGQSTKGRTSVPRRTCFVWFDSKMSQNNKRNTNYSKQNRVQYGMIDSLSILQLHISFHCLFIYLFIFYQKNLVKSITSQEGLLQQKKTWNRSLYQCRSHQNIYHNRSASDTRRQSSKNIHIYAALINSRQFSRNCCYLLFVLE